MSDKNLETRIGETMGTGKDSYYVYMLCEKNSKPPFYIGKGKGERLFQHETEAYDAEKDIEEKIADIIEEVKKEKYLTEDEKSKKIAIMTKELNEDIKAKYKKIESIGKENIERVIIKWGLTEHEAFMAESALMNMFLYINKTSIRKNKESELKDRTLTNIVNGHMSEREKANISHETRAWSTDDFLLECAVPKESILNIKENVRFVFLGDSWPACKDLVLGDVEEQKKAIRDCASAAWVMSADMLEKWEDIDYIFALYKSQVVGTYKLKSKPKRRCELGNDINTLFPKYPEGIRDREKIYSENCAKLNSFKEAKEYCKNNNLPIDEFYSMVVGKKKDEEKAFSDWKNHVFFELEDVEIPMFSEKKLLLIPNQGNTEDMTKTRKFNTGDRYNFVCKKNDVRIKTLSEYNTEERSKKKQQI